MTEEHNTYHVSFEYMTHVGTTDFVEFTVTAPDEETAIERGRKQGNRDLSDAEASVRKL